MPVFKVRGKTFLGMGADCETVVCCIDEQDANQAAAAEPEICQPVQRQDARRSFLGLQMRLDGVPDERVKRLVKQAWRQHAPKRLVAQRDDA